MAFNSRRVYHSGFNHEMAVQKQAPGAAKVGWELRNEHSGASATSRRKRHFPGVESGNPQDEHMNDFES